MHVVYQSANTLVTPHILKIHVILLVVKTLAQKPKLPNPSIVMNLTQVHIPLG